MWPFTKKKPPSVVRDLKCPASGCEFIADDTFDLDRHLEWKHPELRKKPEMDDAK